MPMGLLRHRARTQQCFYCLAPGDAAAAGPSTSTGRTSSWQCSACGCLNTRDAAGNIVSDHPAMRNSALNRRSFELRAGPSSARLPPTSTNPFCRNCLTNQTLVMNLLSNYLPDERDPAYPQLEAELPRYVESLYARYPQVCASCQGGVDEALRKADHRAQAEAWGNALRRGDLRRNGNGVGAEGRNGVYVPRGGPPTALEVAVWRARGGLFLLGAVGSWALGLAATVAPGTRGRIWAATVAGVPAPWAIVAFYAVSLLWAAWDPTWLRRAQSRGQLHVEGRRLWVGTMVALYAARIAGAILLARSSWSALGYLSLVDVVAVLLAYSQLRLKEPVALKLVRPDMTSAASPPAPAPPSFSGLSLGNGPQQPPQPVFGQPSHSAAPRDESEPMDWEPSPAPGTPTDDWQTFGVGRQRMFPQPRQQDETGLESLFSGWGISSGTTPQITPGQLPDEHNDYAPRPRGIVLENRGLWSVRALLLGVRVVALFAAGASHLLDTRLPAASKTWLHWLLIGEAVADAISLAVAVAARDNAAAPLRAVVLASGAGLRTMAIMSGAEPFPPLWVPTSVPHATLEPYGTEIACAAWALLDAFVLAAT
ncbi:hypothetical protein Q8F55_003813 [Vanrija albida]|uniref:Ima1 N-terminal domain-containing protein n=1 Tax=Vanrija albida TaxID=181172 RepID=A0ABR3Q5S8_9TREE